MGRFRATDSHRVTESARHRHWAADLHGWNGSNAEKQKAAKGEEGGRFEQEVTAKCGWSVRLGTTINENARWIACAGSFNIWEDVGTGETPAPPGRNVRDHLNHRAVLLL